MPEKTRLATPEELRGLLNKPQEFWKLLGFEPTSAGLPGDGNGVRIRIVIDPDDNHVPPEEIEFATEAGEWVRALIDPRWERERPLLH